MRVNVGRPPFFGGSLSSSGRCDTSGAAGVFFGGTEASAGAGLLTGSGTEASVGTEVGGEAVDGCSAAVVLTSNAMPWPFSLA
jgi:hypothetical protein